MDIKRITMIRPGKRFERMGFAPPLGLLSIISCVREKFPGKYEIDLIEQALYDLPSEQVGRRINDFAPDMVCFSCLSVEGNEMAEVAALSKAYNADVPVIVGGPHGSVFWDLLLEKDHNIDVVAIGEGEMTFLDLLEAYEDDRPLDEVDGIAFMSNGSPMKTRTRDYIENLDSLPFPAYDLIDFQKYSVQVTMNGFVHSTPWSLIFTSRACPFHCKYCHNVFGKKVRLRSPENVIAELQWQIQTFGIREIHIVDDIFNIYSDRAKQICDMIVDNGIDIKIAFPNGLRGDMMDRELIQKLKRAGCYTITFAVETASERLQKRISKNLNLEKVRQAIEWTHDEGLIPQGFIMLGFPGETLDEIHQTIKFALESKLIRAWIFQVVVYPRTGLFELAHESYPELKLDEWDLFDLRYFTFSPFYTQATGIDLYKIHSKAYRVFHTRPLTVLKIFWRFPKNIFLLRGIYWGIRAAFESVYKLEAIFRPLRKYLSKRFGIFPE